MRDAGKAVLDIWTGDRVRLASGAVARVRRWYVQRNQKMISAPDERVAELVFEDGRTAEMSERYMRMATKLKE